MTLLLPEREERDRERERAFFFFKPNSIPEVKAEAAASHDLNHFGVLSGHTKVAFALLTFAHLTFALLSHSHCCLFRTVGIRTSGFALVLFTLLSFALLSGYLRISLARSAAFLTGFESSARIAAKILLMQQISHNRPAAD